MGRIMLSSLTLVNYFLIKNVELTSVAYLSNKLISIHTKIANLLTKSTLKKLKQFSSIEVVKLEGKLIDEITR